MGTAPYSTGDRLELLLPEGSRPATVSVVMRTGASDPRRHWRLLCRDLDTGTSIEIPIYCGDDGTGDHVPAPVDLSARRLHRMTS